MLSLSQIFCYFWCVCVCFVDVVVAVVVVVVVVCVCVCVCFSLFNYIILFLSPNEYIIYAIIKNINVLLYVPWQCVNV